MPRLWPGETVVCLASGPSLTAEDAAYCRDRARVIVVNRTIERAPWADVFYACDGRVWRWMADTIAAFQGLKFSLDRAAEPYGATVLRNGGVHGLSTDPTTLQNGRNSGYQAINLAVLLGASRVVLLGYDMQPGPEGQMHWHADHPNRTQPPYAACLAAFPTLVAPLQALGIEVINCTRQTALTCFPQAALEAVL